MPLSSPPTRQFFPRRNETRMLNSSPACPGQRARHVAPEGIASRAKLAAGSIARSPSSVKGNTRET
jgi:hypothetical protein